MARAASSGPLHHAGVAAARSVSADGTPVLLTAAEWQRAYADFCRANEGGDGSYPPDPEFDRIAATLAHLGGISHG